MTKRNITPRSEPTRDSESRVKRDAEVKFLKIVNRVLLTILIATWTTIIVVLTSIIG